MNLFKELWMALYYCDILYFVKNMIFLRVRVRVRLCCKEVIVQDQPQYCPESS